MSPWRLAVGILLTAFVASCVNDSWRVRHESAQVLSDFPDGVPFDSAQVRVRASYPRSVSHSPAECEYWAHHGVPAYPAQGGQCIFGTKDVSGFLWGDASISFRLMFTPDGRLTMRYVEPIYTFL